MITKNALIKSIKFNKKKNVNKSQVFSNRMKMHCKFFIIFKVINFLFCEVKIYRPIFFDSLLIYG